MTTGTLQIHSENILPIIKKWLYSDKDIFVRELVSNACDAIHKVKILSDQGVTKIQPDEFRVEIKVDKNARTLTFSDTGIGMDADEVKNYIAQIAFSGAEDFVNKYKTNNEKDQFIGHFGLGFYSAYMVAEKVEIQTLSYKEGAEPVFWSCDGSPQYQIDKGSRTTRGTEITLYIDKDNDEFLEEAKVSQVLSHYCMFMPYPIYLGDKYVNNREPLWIKNPSECTQNDYLEFYRYLYPMEEDPLFWVHLNVDYPFHLKGILYFPKITQRSFDINKQTIKLFCNRVFVSDNCKDVLPDYLMVLRGVIDSPDIPLNVSRSYLQMDRTVRQLGNHVSKKISDSLANLYKNDRERFIQCWEDVSPIIKLGAVEDDKFYERVKDILIWKNVDGKWTTIDEYLERNRDKTKGKILYTKEDKQAAHFLDVYRKRGVEVLVIDSPVDPYVMQSLERKISPVTFQRIDAEIHEHILDVARENTILDAEGKTEATKLAEFVKARLGTDHYVVEAKSLATDSLPAFIMMDEQQRRFRDYMQSVDPKNAQEMRRTMAKQTFVVNTNSALIRSIQKLDTSHPDIAKEMLQEVLELTLLSHKEMEPQQLHDFIARSTRLLEHLANAIEK